MTEASHEQPVQERKRRFTYQVAAQPCGVVPAASTPGVGGALVPALNCTASGTGAGAGTSFSNKGGGVVAGMHVQLIFWGSAWTGNTTPSATQVTESVKNMLAGPYMSALSQYGVQSATVHGTTFITDYNPVDAFPIAGYGGVTDDYIGGFITGLIDKEILPEPDEDSQIFCCVITSPGIGSADPVVAGFNSKVVWNDYDLGDVDNDPIHYGWVGNDGTLDYITTVFSHELVEACTDPGGGTGIIANSGSSPCPTSGACQIGDVCNTICDYVNGVKVQAYWSQSAGVCVIPKFAALRNLPLGSTVTALSTVPGGTSLYVMGLDGQVWSNFFPSPGNPNQWSGWFPLGPNTFPQRSRVTALSTVPGGTSLYVVGPDEGHGGGRVWSNFFLPGQNNDTWSGWFPLGDNIFQPGSIVTALSTVPGGTSLYVVGLDGQVWSNFFPTVGRPNEWSGWFPLNP